MRLLSWDELGSGGALVEPTAATIGVFDGLHIGHRQLVKKVLRGDGLASAVLTFRENPKRILAPHAHQGELSTLAQRLELIESMGVDLCVLIDFSGEFSKLPGRQFLSMLCAGGMLRYLAVGADFRCGHRLDTGAEDIREFCSARSIEVEVLEAVLWAGHPVSSSRIRRAILEGRLEEAGLMLGRPYEIDLRGASSAAAGRFLPAPGQASPPPGVYEAAIAIEACREPASTAAAELGGDGTWTVGSAAGSTPRGLRLLRRYQE
jgi:riboflavin kinase/FMN adenylyltransferase